MQGVHIKGLNIWGRIVIRALPIFLVFSCRTADFVEEGWKRLASYMPDYGDLVITMRGGPESYLSALLQGDVYLETDVSEKENAQILQEQQIIAFSSMLQTLPQNTFIEKTNRVWCTFNENTQKAYLLLDGDYPAVWVHLSLCISSDWKKKKLTKGDRNVTAWTHTYNGLSVIKFSRRFIAITNSNPENLAFFHGTKDVSSEGDVYPEDIPPEDIASEMKKSASRNEHLVHSHWEDLYTSLNTTEMGCYWKNPDLSFLESLTGKKMRVPITELWLLLREKNVEGNGTGFLGKEYSLHGVCTFMRDQEARLFSVVLKLSLAHWLSGQEIMERVEVKDLLDVHVRDHELVFGGLVFSGEDIHTITQSILWKAVDQW